jgi:8-oxo-dGTP pyrophosphatase MutT (NUDIX family)
MSFLDHIRACNRWDPADFVPFRVDGLRVGLVRRAFASELRRWPEIFRVDDEALHWVHPATGFAERSSVMADTLQSLVEAGLVSHLHGEKYPVTAGNRREALFLIDRACAPSFGVRAFGQHLNGFVRADDGLKLWVARRSADRRIYPNHLDNLVAGGLPSGVSLDENLRKECREEAGMSAALAQRAVPVGAVTYCRDSARGLKPDVMYCYDLELPARFEPRCTDGEVQAFYLWPVERVLDTVRDTNEFKLNCNLVIIDFLIRHGRISQDDPDYLELIRGLRGALP